MRQLKFRGKCKERKIPFDGIGNTYEVGDWVFGYFIQMRGKAIIINELESVEVDPDTVGQFTGLTDKNAGEIYEGDIVVFDAQMWSPNPAIPSEKITLADYSYRDSGIPLRGYVCVDVKYSLWQVLVPNSEYPKKHISCAIRGEIIGNIHDNPELLTKTE